MSEYSIELPTLITATFMLSLCATIAWISLRCFRHTGSRIHRMVWFVVLLQGVMLAKFSVEIPVLEHGPTLGFAKLIQKSSEIPPASINLTSDGQVGFNDAQSNAKSMNIPDASPSLATNLTAVESDAAKIEEFTPPRNSESNTTKGLIAIWIAGMVIVFSYMILSYGRVLSLLQRTDQAPREWSVQLAQLCDKCSLRKPISMLVHESLGPSLVLGPQGYRIVVPFEIWSRMSVSQRASVLRHEIEHYKRGDIVKSFLAFLVTAIHWFNPFAWIAFAKLNSAAEWACDDAAADNEVEQSEFARALLSISTSNSAYLVGTHGFGSSDLKARIRRMLSDSRKPSVFGNMAIGTVAVVIMLCGWINLRLIAEPAIASIASPVQDDVELEKNIDELASNLDGSDRNKKLFSIVKSPAGKIAIINSVTDIEEGMRKEHAKNIVPEFFENLVDESFVRSFKAEVATAKKDIATLSVALTEIKNKIRGSSAADKLLLRFLNSQNAATTLYFGELRKQMRPGRQLLMQNLGRFLAQNKDGKFIVRESVKAVLMQKLEPFVGVDEQLQFLKTELKLLGEELVGVDELHQECKSRLLASRGAAVVIAMSFRENEDPDDQITGYLNQLEEYFEDGPDGLVIFDEVREQLKQGMGEMDKLVRKMKRLKEPISKIASSVDDQAGQEERTVKQFLQSEIGLAVLSMQIELQDSESVIEQIETEILQESGEGYVVREDRKEEISEFSRNMLKANRSLRRQLRMVDSRVAKVPRETIEGLLESDVAKLVLIERVKDYAEQIQFDAWPVWLDTHFDSIDGKYQVREESLELIDHLVEEAKAIEAELSNDDF